ncbi:MAG: Gfo/Idh/MocA family oxidoreductase [Planctomycetes bacterium]|nr:Gfo/Idh/MocA family oxidoreductase [Planctomycetota bacterium]MBL7107196.1 Gfo/Idh/MocA family oxidoreductase [Phycisphaerae bacterium]
MRINLGIIGCGSIAGHFANDIKYTKHCRLYAVGSRSQKRAKGFAKNHNAACAYSSYHQLLADPAVDAVYVATPHPFHMQNTLDAIAAGKAVLCEKPFAVNAAQAAEMIRTAKKKKVFLMEAMWTRFFPAMIAVREWLDEKAIGHVLSIRADFCAAFNKGPKHRINDPKLGGGALLDVGIYVVSFASMVKSAQPKKISSSVHMTKTGVDDQAALLFDYQDGTTAQLGCSSRHSIPAQGWIYGTKGTICIHENFYHPNKITLCRDGKKEITRNFRHRGLGFRYEADFFAKCVLDGKTDNDIISHEETLAIMKTTDKIRKQWKLKYPFE